MAGSERGGVHVWKSVSVLDPISYSNTPSAIVVHQSSQVPPPRLATSRRTGGRPMFFFVVVVVVCLSLCVDFIMLYSIESDAMLPCSGVS